MDYLTPYIVVFLINFILLPLLLWYWPVMNKDGRDGPWRAGPLKLWTLAVWELWRDQLRHFEWWISYTFVPVVLIGFFLLPIMFAISTSVVVMLLILSQLNLL